MRRPIVTATIAALVLTVSTAPTARAQVVVTQCGTLVSSEAVLGADLDCSGSCVPAVFIENGASLHFNGFTLTGAAPSVPSCSDPVVQCVGGCTLVGPGTIAGGPFGVCASEYGSCSTYEPRGKLVMTDMTVRDTRRTAVFAGYLRMENCVVSGTGPSRAVHAARSARISTSTIENNGLVGITGTRVRVIGSTIRDNGDDGLSIGNGSKLVDTVVTGNGGYGIYITEGRVKVFGGVIGQNATDGVAARKALVEGTTISENGGVGLSVGYGRVADATIVGNADSGVECWEVQIESSEVSGNCVASPNPVECADLTACGIAARDVSCGTSLCRGPTICYDQCPAGQSFGVCSSD
jgi:hypothetical protein